jgi:hypothetical protein
VSDAGVHVPGVFGKGRNVSLFKGVACYMLSPVGWKYATKKGRVKWIE